MMGCSQYLLVVGCLALLQCAISSFLTSFQPSNLNIRLNALPQQQFDNPHNQDLTVLYETIDLLQNHFIYRDRYKKSDWDAFRKEFSQYQDTKEAVRELLRRLQEPYTRYIDYSIMKDRRRSLNGVALSIGVNFRRHLHLEDLSYAMRTLFIPSLEFKESLKHHFNYWKRALIKVAQKKDAISPSSVCSGSISQYYQTIEQSLMPSFNSHKELLQDLFDYSKAYFSIALPSYMGFFAFKNSNLVIRRRLFYVLAATTLSAILLSVQLIPFIYPLEVCSMDIKTSQQSGIKEGDRLAMINGRKIQHLSYSEMKKLLKHGEVGDKVILQMIRKAVLLHEEDDPFKDSDVHISSSSSSNTFLSSPFNLPARKILASSKMKGGEAMTSTSQYSSLINHNNKNIENQSNRRKKKRKVLYEQKMFELVKNYVDATKLEYNILPTNQGKGLGYIQIKEFNDKTYCEFKHALQDLDRQFQQQTRNGLRALIIDLRGNPGGPVSPALDVAAIFLRRGKPLLQMSVQGKMEKYHSKNAWADEKTAILLLTDSNTASASEMLTEALCGNSRAISMGRKTVGKNFAQVIMSLSDGSGLCFTVREFFSPDGR